MSESPVFDNVVRHGEVVNSPEYKQLADELDAAEVVPNVKVENPNTRRILTTIAGVVGAILGTAIAVDLSTPAFDLSAWTNPITAGFLYLTAFYGITVTLPNTPKRHG